MAARTITVGGVTEASSLNDLADVDAVDPSDGQTLVWATDKWTASEVPDSSVEVTATFDGNLELEPGDTLADALTQIDALTVSGGGGGGAGLVAAAGPSTPLVSSAAETSIFASPPDLPALTAGAVVAVHGVGRWLNSSGATRTLTIRVKVGATTIVTLPSIFNVGSSTTERGFTLQGWIRMTGADETDAAFTVIPVGVNNPIPVHSTGVATEAVQDGALPFDITFQHSASNASLEVQMLNLTAILAVP